MTKMNNDDYFLYFGDNSDGWMILCSFFGLVDLAIWSNDNDDKSFLNSRAEEEGQALGKVTTS